MLETEHRNYPMPEDADLVRDGAELLRTLASMLDLDVAELIAGLAGKADADHGHAPEDLPGLLEAIASRAPISHTHSLGGLSNVEGADEAAEGYVLVKTHLGWIPMSAAAAIGNHQHAIEQIQGLVEALDQMVDGAAVDVLAGLVAQKADAEALHALLQKAQNLGDLEDTATARENLGVKIGEDVQAFMPAASQAEAEGGEDTELRAWSPLRIAEAIAALAGAGSALQEFTSSGSWVKPDTGNLLILYGVGAGASGSRFSGQAGAGGAGGYGDIYVIPLALLPASVAVTIGAKGVGTNSSSNNFGNDGGATSFGSFAFWPGGGRGGVGGGSNVLFDTGAAANSNGKNAGGGSNTTNDGGSSVLGGAGGGGGGTGTGNQRPGGTSRFAGDGGNGATGSGIAGNGDYPGGGGGGSGNFSGTQGRSGDGADGYLLTVVI